MVDSKKAVATVVIFLSFSLLAVSAFSMYQSSQEISKINAEQLGDCVFMDCRATFFNGIECEEVKNPFPMKTLNSSKGGGFSGSG